MKCAECNKPAYSILPGKYTDTGEDLPICDTCVDKFVDNVIEIVKEKSPKCHIGVIEDADGDAELGFFPTKTPLLVMWDGKELGYIRTIHINGGHGERRHVALVDIDTDTVKKMMSLQGPIMVGDIGK